MRLPPHLLESVGFQFGDPDLEKTTERLLRALRDDTGNDCDELRNEIRRLVIAHLPPVVSLDALAVMIGYSPSFVWYLIHRKDRLYRIFTLTMGRKRRQIEAPRVALKIIQKWLAFHWEKKWRADVPQWVHGFVRGRSHLTAAQAHLGAKWVLSVDIQDAFPSTSAEQVSNALRALGYHTDESVEILTALTTWDGRLPQGAPTSPVLFNIAFSAIDGKLGALARRHRIRLTRYADDIVFSGIAEPPSGLLEDLHGVFEGSSWQIHSDKIEMKERPTRLKVHGLLVDGDRIRLTKGYRNKIRLYRFLLESKSLKPDEERRLKGHVAYADHVERLAAPARGEA
ncbi:MAG: hypothetical protein KatS3mg119_0944 [Rhodothalassiaceae bacterium]|nr:MAG: hypothetical protein KatS3mg119_0944 [Rhodothalassiaceae bacterium]